MGWREAELAARRPRRRIPLLSGDVLPVGRKRGVPGRRDRGARYSRVSRPAEVHSGRRGGGRAVAGRGSRDQAAGHHCARWRCGLARGRGPTTYRTIRPVRRDSARRVRRRVYDDREPPRDASLDGRRPAPRLPGANEPRHRTSAGPVRPSRNPRARRVVRRDTVRWPPPRSSAAPHGRVRRDGTSEIRARPSHRRRAASRDRGRGDVRRRAPIARCPSLRDGDSGVGRRTRRRISRDRYVCGGDFVLGIEDRTTRSSDDSPRFRRRRSTSTAPTRTSSSGRAASRPGGSTRIPVSGTSFEPKTSSAARSPSSARTRRRSFWQRRETWRRGTPGPPSRSG